MGLEWIEDTIEQKAVFRLLRAKHAAFALECMFSAFPTSETIERTRSDLTAIVSSRITERLAQGLGAPERQVEAILTHWSENTPRWLTARLGTSGEMSYTLSPGARDAMQFIEQVRTDAKISTQSLMTNLMATIEDAASRLNGDAGQRITHLQNKIQEIEAEIADLKANGLTPLDDNAIADVAARVQVDTAQILSQLRDMPDMLADFRNRSEELTYTDIRPKSEVMTDLVGYHEDLHATQAYRSMVAMSHLYSQTSMRARFDAALAITLHAARTHLEPAQAKAIRAFMTSFTRATNTIVDEERRVFYQQKDYLQRNESEESRREKRAAMALNRALVRVREENPSGPRGARFVGVKLCVSAFSHKIPRKATLHLDVKMPEPATTRTVVDPIGQRDLSDSAKRVRSRVALGKSTNTDALMVRITELLQEHDAITLHDVLQRFPPKTGLKEIIHYLKIAASHLPATFAPGALFDITTTGQSGGRLMRLVAPNPTFVRSGKPGQGLAEFVSRTKIVPGTDGRTTRLLLPDTSPQDIESDAQ